MTTDTGSITTGPITGTGIAIGHGASATVNITYQHARPTPVSAEQLAEAHRLLATLPLESVPDVGVPPSGSRMVFTRNPLFTGRTKDLQELARILKDGGAAAISQVVAASGLGGIGKTQLAVEFAHRYGRYFAGGVFWVSAASADDVKHQIAQCGGAAGMQLRADYDALKLDEQVALVLSEWQSPLPRLLIFDNCESEELLQQWRPPAGGCRILITSRNAEWDLTLGVQTLALGVLSRAESVELLLKFRPDLSGLEAIAEELGDLPLALHLAGSHLRRYRVGGEELLRELRRPDLLTHPALTGLGLKVSPTGHENHVVRTFALSYLCLDQADEVDALALKALTRAACFVPGIPIPRELLKKTLGEASSKMSVEGSLHRLTELGLLTPSDEGALILHRLLAAFVKDAMPIAEALDSVKSVLYHEASGINHHKRPEPLRPWAAHLRYVAEQLAAREPDWASALFFELGYHLKAIADYTRAKVVLDRALKFGEEAFGADHVNVAAIKGELGTLAVARGDLAEARASLEYALHAIQTAYGADHSYTANSWNDLGLWLLEAGEYAEAQKSFENTLAIQEKALSPDQADIGATLNNLGMALNKMGRYADAKTAFERAITILTTAVGPDHPTLVTAVNNQGIVLNALGDYAGAQLAFEQAMASLEQTLGPEHPHVAFTLNNLGEALRSQGKAAEARLALERAAASWEKILGPEHPNVALALANLGGALLTLGDTAQARQVLERAAAIWEKVYGPEHPDLAMALNNLGEVLRAQGDYEGARAMAIRAMAILEKTLGPDHPRTGLAANNLGVALLAQGEVAAARTTFIRAARLFESALGPQHPLTRQASENVGMTVLTPGCLSALGRLERLFTGSKRDHQ